MTFPAEMDEKEVEAQSAPPVELPGRVTARLGVLNGAAVVVEVGASVAPRLRDGPFLYGAIDEDGVKIANRYSFHIL